MDNQTIQIISVGVIFISTFLCALLPLKVIGKGGHSHHGRLSGSERLLGVCNCLAGGVFLTTCFLGLIPSARRKFTEIQMEQYNSESPYPITEAVVLVGFYMILILERIVTAVQAYGCKKDDSYLFEMDQLSSSQRERGHRESSPSESDEEIDLFEMTSSSKPMLQGPRLNENGRVNSARKSKSSKHWPSGRRHGHSHLKGAVDDKNIGRSLILLMALSVHSVFEGMALGVQDQPNRTVYLIVAILAHETLAAFALGSNMVKNGVTWRLLCLYSFIFSIMIPTGIAIGLTIKVGENRTADIASAVTQAIAAGVFLFVTFFEIFGQEFEKQQDWVLKVIFSLVGFLLLAGLEVVVI